VGSHFLDARSSEINVRGRYPNRFNSHGIQMMRGDAVHSAVISQQSSDINFLCLTNVAMKLSHTVLLDCIRVPGSYSFLQNPETFDDLLHI
jgi:hypothetical protein